LIWQYLKNLGLLLNMTVSTVVLFQDPRKTLSAFLYQKGYKGLVGLVNKIYRDPLHCKTAAQGWADALGKESAWSKKYDRSLW
jgi:hypothetical protein